MFLLKRKIKQYLIESQHKKYNRSLSQKKLSYGEWIGKKEKKISEELNCTINEISADIHKGKTEQNAGFWSEDGAHCRKFSVSDGNGREKEMLFLVFDCSEYQEREWKTLAEEFEGEADAVLFLIAGGELSALCLPLLYREFLREEGMILIYGDEDVRTQEAGGGSEREKPWFKPDWSPDTFLSSFYFGSLAAVRTEPLKELLAEKGEKISSLYELCFYLIRGNGGFEKKTPGRTRPVFHIPEILFHGREEGYEAVKNLSLTEGEPALETEEAKNPVISIIIPSKDNPDVLLHCLQSLFCRTKEGYAFEILIIDNGSNEENRKRIAAETEERNRKETKKRKDFLGIRYHYEPMEFNFSRMCNIAATKAEGQLLLFLNDDMEIIQGDWLLLLSQKALLPRAGAVGAKLLYPDSTVIQHAGITNLRVGPAHKMQFLSDEEVHYYGRNRGIFNVLAVTGACLMVKKEIFEQAGGFFEGLAVAFNDVDLCYTIFENGYDNMVRNDVVLYHHESLSRGRDGESEEKQRRLLREKDLLYMRHQEQYGTDPFYHKYLTSDMLESGYSPASHYEVRLDMPCAQVKGRKRLPCGVREDPCVVIGMECAMDVYKWKYGVEAGKGKEKPLPEDQGYYFRGYSFVIGGDNACYRRTLILQEKETRQIIQIPVEDEYRKDICDNLKDQINVELTGFAARVRLMDVPRGCYRFGMLQEDRCSRQKLVAFSNWVLQTGEGVWQA